MFKKLNSGTLLVVFVILAVLLIIVNVVDKKKGSRTFPENLIEIDTADISKIEVSSLNTGKNIILERSDRGWQLNSEGKMIGTNKSKIRTVLNALANVKPTGLVAQEEEAWRDYQLTDSSAVRVEMYVKNRKKSDLLIGRIEYTPSNNNNYYGGGQGQQAGNFKTYVRLYDDKKVYSVPEMLRMTFTNDFDSYRDPMVVAINPDEVSKVTFVYPADSSFVLLNEEGVWKLDGQDADSLKVANYLNKLKNITSLRFVDQKPIGDANMKITLEGEDIAVPITLSSYPYHDTTFVVTSTINPEACFDGESVDLHKKLFVGRTGFVEN